jgi:hypothetical protein
MEGRLRRIERWIERCIAAWRAGKPEAAMAELACAKAELDMAGEEMWRFCASKGHHKRAISPWRLVRPAGVLLGVVIVLATALPLSNPPLSKDQGVHIQRLGFEAPDLRLEFVTEDEGRLLNLLRESLSSTREEQFADFQVSEPSLSRNEKAEMTMPSRPEASSRSASGISEAPVSTVASSVPLEEFLTLVQVGERALRGENSHIIFEKP